MEFRNVSDVNTFSRTERMNQSGKQMMPHRKCTSQHTQWQKREWNREIKMKCKNSAEATKNNLIEITCFDELRAPWPSSIASSSSTTKTSTVVQSNRSAQINFIINDSFRCNFHGKYVFSSRQFIIRINDNVSQDLNDIQPHNEILLAAAAASISRTRCSNQVLIHSYFMWILHTPK